MIGNEFWQTIESDFNEVRSYLSEIRLFSRKERDACAIERVMPGIISERSLDATEFDLKNCRIIFTERLSANNKMYLVLAAIDLGISVPDDLIANFDGLVPGTSEIIYTIEDAISKKSLDDKFIVAWGKWQHAYGVVSTMLEDIEPASKYFKKYIKTASSSNIIQHHIYAYWMFKRWTPKKKVKDQRLILHEELAKKIRGYTRKHPDKFKDILSSMVIEDKITKELELNGKAIYMTSARLNEIVQNKLIPPSNLPNLD